MELEFHVKFLTLLDFYEIEFFLLKLDFHEIEFSLKFDFLKIEFQNRDILLDSFKI